MGDYRHFETKAIRTQSENGLHREHSAPIYMTSSFTFDSAEQAVALFNDEEEGNIYTRYSNPNTDELVKKLCLLENTEDGIAMASGMSAMFSSMAGLLQKGDHVLASRSVFGSTHQLFTQVFPKWGISHTYAEIGQPETWPGLVKKNTKMVFAETPSNPGLDVIDLAWLGEFCQERGLILNIDNCFATPYLQRPAEYGASLVTHSATKFMDGQGRVIGGAVLGTKELIEKIRFFARHTGPSLSPFNAWVLSKSLETLPVRMEKHCENAFKLAEYLEGHEELEFVKHPFLDSHPQQALAKKQMLHGGALITFSVKGGIERSRNFLNQLKMLSLTANLGDTRTTVTHPASTTHSKLTEAERQQVGIVPGLVRVSVGLENVNDILEDIENALKLSKPIQKVTVS